jgi:hypothetical protein
MIRSVDHERMNGKQVKYLETGSRGLFENVTMVFM